MKFTTIATATLALATSAFAAPSSWGSWPNCLAQSEAESIVNQYISVLAHSNVQTANATGQALLTDDYQEISDSILSLEGQALGGVTFQGKQNYINGVLSAQPVAGVNTIEILVAGCTKILWYWNFTGIGTGKYEVKGFNLFTLNSDNMIEKAHIEFNSIAWGLDTGYTVTFPADGGSATK